MPASHTHPSELPYCSPVVPELLLREKMSSISFCKIGFIVYFPLIFRNHIIIQVYYTLVRTFNQQAEKSLNSIGIQGFLCLKTFYFYFSKSSTSSCPSLYPASLSCSTNHSSTPSTASFEGIDVHIVFLCECYTILGFPSAHDLFVTGTVDVTLILYGFLSTLVNNCLLLRCQSICKDPG